MVHRAADSRLLNNLLSHEKDYHKHLLSLLDSSHAALASASAYAAASQPPASTVILSVTSSFAAADEALLRYATSVDEWRERLKQLKSLEEDIATIIRDREILVTRLIKASKNEKPNRDSILLAQHQPYPSSSTLSLKSDYTGALNTSTKLAAAQSELQACETHLAEKERELDALRLSAVKDGLSARCRSMLECGWVWGEMGKAALQVIDNMGNDNAPNALSPRSSLSFPIIDQPRTAIPHPNGVQAKPHITIDPDPPRQSSDLSSLTPSQSASQVNISPPIPPPSTHIYSDIDYFDSVPPGVITSASASQTSQSQTLSQSLVVSQPEAQIDTHQHIQILPPHSISDLDMPTSVPPPQPQSQPAPVTPERSTSPQKNARYYTPNGDTSYASGSTQKHILSRRITEEDLNHDEAGDSSEEGGGTQPEGYTVVENPRFASQHQKSSSANTESAPQLAIVNRRFSLRPRAQSTQVQDTSTITQEGSGSQASTPRALFAKSEIHIPQPGFAASGSSLSRSPDNSKRERRASTGVATSFFGSLRGLFKSRGRGEAGDSDGDNIAFYSTPEPSPHQRRNQTSPESPSSSGFWITRGKGKAKSKWETRTERNLKGIAKDNGEVNVPGMMKKKGFRAVSVDGGARPLEYVRSVGYREDEDDEAAFGYETPTANGKGRPQVETPASSIVSVTQTGGGRRLRKGPPKKKARSSSLPPTEGQAQAQASSSDSAPPNQDVPAPDPEEQPRTKKRLSSAGGGSIGKATGKGKGMARKRSASLDLSIAPPAIASLLPAANGHAAPPSGITMHPVQQHSPHRRTASLDQGPGASPKSSMKSLDGGKKATGLPTRSATMIVPSAPPSSIPSRSNTIGQGGRGYIPASSFASASAKAPGGVASLMALVEDVTRSNQVGWENAQKAKRNTGGVTGPNAGGNAAAGGGISRSSSKGKAKEKERPKSLQTNEWSNTGLAELLEVVKAPPSVNRGDLEWAVYGNGTAIALPKSAGAVDTVFKLTAASTSATSLRSGSLELQLPKAPGSVFGQVYGSSLAQQTQMAASASAPHLPTTRTEVDRGVSKSPTPAVVSTQTKITQGVSLTANGTSNGISTPPKLPLRSALRNSRTPSPAPVPGPRAMLSGRRIQTGEDAPPVPPLPPVYASMNGNGNNGNREQIHDVWRAGVVIGSAREDDGKDGEDSDDASISSYATGHESFEEGRSPTTGRPLMNDVPLDEGSGTSTPTTLVLHIGGAAGGPEPQAASSSPLSAQSGIVVLESSNRDQDGQQDHNQDPQTQPQRKKSVRVSLKPTFSPTPPAIDDDDDRDEMAPWGGRGRLLVAPSLADETNVSIGSSTGSSGSGSGSGTALGHNFVTGAASLLLRPTAITTHAGRHGAAGEANGNAKMDIWDDSSDNDEDYERARKLLRLANVKKKKDGW